MGGRQVLEVSPISVGGSLFSIAVGCRGTDVQKVGCALYYLFFLRYRSFYSSLILGLLFIKL